MEESVLLCHKFPKSVLIHLTEVVKLHEPFHQNSPVSPVIRIVAACVIDYAAVPACSESVVIVVWKEEELIIILVCRIEVDVEVVSVVPMVVAHADNNIHSIGLEKELHITYFLNPFIETFIRLAGKFQNEVFHLCLCRCIILLISLELIVIVDSCVQVYSPRSVKILKVGRRLTPAAFPEITFVTLEHSVNSALDEFVINRLNHFIDTVICRLSISYLKPETAVDVMCGSPDAIASEKVITIEFAHIVRVILEPFEIDLADAVDGVVGILMELSEVDAEMTVMPVGVVRIMQFTAVSFGSAS